MLQSGKIESQREDNLADATRKAWTALIRTCVYKLPPEFKTHWPYIDVRSVDRTNERFERITDQILNAKSHSLSLYLPERRTKSLSSSTSFMASFGSSIAPPLAKRASKFWEVKGDFSDPGAPSERRIVSSISHWTVLWPSPQGTTNHLSLNRTDNLMISSNFSSLCSWLCETESLGHRLIINLQRIQTCLSKFQG